MSDDLYSIHEFDQKRAEARRFAEALAGDVIAYHKALAGAGIEGELLSTLVSQFNASWLGPITSDAEIVFSMDGIDDD